MKKFSMVLIWISGFLFGLAVACDYQPGFVIYGLISLAGLMLGLWVWVSGNSHIPTKKLVAMIILVGLVLSLPLFAMGEDSKEVLTLKRDLAQEKVVRIQSQLALMQQQFAEGQKFLADTQNLLKDLNAKLDAMEPRADKPKEAKPDGKPRVEEKKK